MEACEIKINGMDKGRAIIIPTNAKPFSIATKAEKLIRQVRPKDKIKKIINMVKKLILIMLLK